MQYTLNLNPLSKQAFEPYGDVIQIDGAHHFSINNGTIERFHDLATIETGNDEEAMTLLSIAQSNQASQLPLRIHLLERHPLASQAFYPLFDEPMIVVVAPHGEQVSPASLKAFYSNGKQGVNFSRGVWHLPLIALRPQQKFLIVDRGGPGNNCEEYHFNSLDEITLQELT